MNNTIKQKKHKKNIKNKKNKKILISILTLILLIIIFLVIPNIKNKRIKENIKGSELIELCKNTYKQNVKNNKKPKMQKMIKKNTNLKLTDEYLGNYPNGKNSLIIKIKIEDKTYSMGEIIKIKPEKLLEAYKDRKFKKTNSAMHENGKVSYIYYELQN